MVLSITCQLFALASINLSQSSSQVLSTTLAIMAVTMGFLLCLCSPIWESSTWLERCKLLAAPWEAPYCDLNGKQLFSAEEGPIAKAFVVALRQKSGERTDKLKMYHFSGTDEWHRGRQLINQFFKKEKKRFEITVTVRKLMEDNNIGLFWQVARSPDRKVSSNTALLDELITDLDSFHLLTNMTRLPPFDTLFVSNFLAMKFWTRTVNYHRQKYG